MTILHLTDFHFNKHWFDWLLNRAPAHNLAVMSGDLLDLASMTPHRRQIDWVSGWMKEYAGPLSLCSGNHDLEWDSAADRWTPAYWLRDLAKPNIWVDGDRVTLDGLSVLNIGCTTRPKGGEADIWVVHAPPTRTLVSARTTGGDGGDRDLIAPLRRYAPRLVFSGHVHNPTHWCHRAENVLYLNPGYRPGATIPNHILVQTETLACQHMIASEAPAIACVAANPSTETAAARGNTVVAVI